MAFICVGSMIAASSVLSRTCEPFCKEPCAVLNGNIADECGGCDATFTCRPGAHGFPTVFDEQPLAKDGNDAKHVDVQVAPSGAKSTSEKLTAIFGDDPPASTNSTMSLYDAWFLSEEPNHTCAAATAALMSSAYRCADLENEVRTKDRGFFILRQAADAADP